MAYGKGSSKHCDTTDRALCGHKCVLSLKHAIKQLHVALLQPRIIGVTCNWKVYSSLYSMYVYVYTLKIEMWFLVQNQSVGA